ncbi:serine/arginine repetitive matrix protein 1-like isoform X2 [Iris pallida]|uniref:Serine/arginine repetitive matrix protein 1-like isoform X2 n=1 Tax=Iris pallida TaxID=29817 RepID=A0AAX6I2U3_IRIPA|nr:serine/arginine repetitive matrix protein 1-like isoform X2 [Iris pallida]KAJ6847104.1 serine/arginine repetitive matrix protein 1-like isoform X2 [Iris pallida]
MFLHIVNVPDSLKVADTIENEMSQLEETRKFHLSLYSKGDQSGSGTTDFGCMKEVALNQHINVETTSSDATKNELLRALDLRLMALKEELAALLNRATGATCSRCQISNLAAFVQYFGVTDLRNILLKLLAWSPKDLPDDPSHEQLISSHKSENDIEKTTEAVSQPSSQPNKVKPVTNLVSPAKIAQAERECSTESESSDSSHEDQSHAERSRPLLRSASPRRSASPIRRIQIGRSGSRRSTALTIKSLNYFPGMVRNLSIRDAEERSSSGDEEPDQPPKKPESQGNPVRSISVKDAINLFECKQKDLNVVSQKKKGLGEVSTNTTAKSVLRRWSAGMGDSFNQCSLETTSDDAPQNREENKSEELIVESSAPDKRPQLAECSSVEEITVPQMEHAEPEKSNVEDVNDRATASAEWSRQKEAELKEMLMKLMEAKPGKHRGSTNVGSGLNLDVSDEQKGGFCKQNKEKREEKLQVENAGKRTSREARSKVMMGTHENRKVEIPLKPGNVARKLDSPNHSQKTRRNSAPPLLPKKEVPKPTVTRKVLPKTPLPATRNSWSSGPLPRASGTQGPLPRASGTPTTKKMPATSRKSQPTPSTQPSPRTERALQQTKVRKGNPADVKPRKPTTDAKSSPKGQEEKQQKPVTSNSRSVKTKSSTDPGDAKPSFYSKVTKKSSVVPLESKPFLRKGTGIGPGVGPVIAKTKVSQFDESSKSSGNIIQGEEIESCSVTAAEPTTQGLEIDLDQPKSNLDVDMEDMLENIVIRDSSSDLDESSIIDSDNGFKHVIELPVSEIQVDEDLGISSAAWVEVECQDGSALCDNGQHELTTSPGLAPPTASSSPRVRHSLSQIMQADSNEPEIIEWGNAENPPALVYQKDAPKGLKRLLKFARKSKGDGNVTGWGSPSVFSEGEDDKEESKAASKRSSDALLRKVALQAKSYEPQKTVLTGSFDGGNYSKGSVDCRGVNDTLSAQSSTSASTVSNKLRELHTSASSTSSKGSRSFFSLSTFRSTKSSETKFR